MGWKKFIYKRKINKYAMGLRVKNLKQEMMNHWKEFTLSRLHQSKAYSYLTLTSHFKTKSDCFRVS